MPFELYNTQTNQREPVRPADATRVTFYSCGPTVYDDAHIGNFRSFLAADLLRRWLESPLCELDFDGEISRGPRTVIHVMNITDVGHMTDDDNADGAGEDKMEAAQRRLTDAKKSGKLPAGVEIDPTDQLAIARFYTDRFMQDARKLGLKVALEADSDPSLMPRATDNVEGMIALIQRLIDQGAAYQAGDAVYFSVESYPAYGVISGNTIDDIRAGAGGRISDDDQQSKRHPADFLLWKRDPRHAMRWESPWGEGYPGWHLECSVMALDRLDPQSSGTIDLHSGGEDNIFPHHECENAQSCCATGAERFARHWFHPRFLMVEGDKMSKSKGNFLTARDLFAKGHEPAAVRLELIKTHYRSNANFTEQGLKDAERLVNRWRAFIDKATDQSGGDEAARTHATQAFAKSMNDDLNIAGALGALNAWIGDTPRPTADDAKLMRTFDDVLGVLTLERPKQADTGIAIFTGGLEPDDRVVQMLEERRAAKKAKDFAEADRIRDELTEMGYAIKDAPEGKVEVGRV
ncbi:MAG: cysteine--tRNA ligase [Planctomycetota bacterium]